MDQNTILGLMVIIFSVLIGFMAMGFIMTWMKSQRLRIRDPLNNNKYIEDFWMVEKKEKKTGVLNWKSVIWQKKLVIPEPPKDCITVGKKGRKFVEAYKLSEDEFVFINDKGIAVKEVNGKMTAVDIQLDGTEKVIDSFEPFTTTQRQVLINQHTKADEISKKRWGVSEVMGVIGMGSMVMVIAMLLIFGGDLMKEYRASRAGATEVLKQSAQITKAQALLLQNLGIHIDDLNIELSQAPSPQVENTQQQSSSGFDIRTSVGLD